MADVVVLVLVVAALGACGWLLAGARTLPLTTRRPVSPHRISVVVPARDEERSLPVLLGSLTRQTVAPLEVVVVDDGSRDRTAAVASEHGARVLAPGEPPPGWTGKAWACHRGAASTTGDVLVFLDADVELRDHALEALLAAHAAEGGLVSVQPYHHVVRPHENLSAHFNAVGVLASGAFARRPAGRPMAFGPCLMTRRDDYLRAGGHDRVRGAILDDVDLAVSFRDAGLPVTCYLGGESVRMRSYPDGWRQLASGWTKNIASGAAAADPRAALAAVVWVSAQHAVGVGALVALVEVLTRDATGPDAAARLAMLLVSWLVLAWQLRTVLRRLGDFRWWTWLCFPVPLLAFDLLFFRSALRTLVRRSVRWRGRDVDLRGRTAGQEVA